MHVEIRARRVELSCFAAPYILFQVRVALEPAAQRAPRCRLHRNARLKVHDVSRCGKRQHSLPLDRRKPGSIPPKLPGRAQRTCELLAKRPERLAFWRYEPAYLTGCGSLCLDIHVRKVARKLLCRTPLEGPGRKVRSFLFAFASRNL